MISIKHIFFVAAGGALGSALRYIIAIYTSKLAALPGLPLGTFLVNVVGCFLLGILYGKTGVLNKETFLFLATGFCGGFTTFSTFSLENVQLFQSENSVAAVLYLGLSITIGLLAVLAGMNLSK